MSVDEAVRLLRADPRHADLIRNAYLGADVMDSARRFAASAEFQEVRRLLSLDLSSALVADVGSGTGIAAYAFAVAGSRLVCAIDPDPSEEVGVGASGRLGADRFQRVIAVGEALPLRDDSVSVVYVRQTLHHARDLGMFLHECARVLKPAGVLVATREHVADDARQLDAFRRNHPIHQLAGGENAFRLDEYLQAMQAGGLVVEQILGPWDTVINAFPAAGSETECLTYPSMRLRQRFGLPGELLARLPFVQWALWKWLKRPVAGRLYSFVARKPISSAT